MTNLKYIDLYFNGTPGPEEKARFEKRVLEDPSFAEEVAFFLSVERLALQKAMAEKKDRFRQLYRHSALPASGPDEAPEVPEAGESPETPRLPRVPPVRRIKRYWYAAAAAILFLIAGTYLFVRQPAPERLAEQYIHHHFDKLGVSMSSGNDPLQEGLQLFNKGRFADAARHFEQVLRQDTANFTAKKYAGIAFLRLADYDKALHYFGKLEQHSGLYANPAKLYQAVTRLRRNGPGDKAQARRLLHEIVAQKAEGKKTAEEWLRKL